MRDYRSAQSSLPISDFAENLTAEPIKFDVSERLYSPEEVADRLGVSERWVRDHATRRHPRIRAVKLGPLLRFRWADVEHFVATQTIDFSRFKKPPRGVK
jgi:excisionase family DNA binding protein